MDSTINKGVVAGSTNERKSVGSGAYDKKRHFTIPVQTKKYERQFFGMYQYRLDELRNRVYENAIKKWGDGNEQYEGNTIVRQDKILGIKSGQICWVIGTIFCDLKNKLNILQDVEKGTDDVLPMFPLTYVGDGKEEKGTIMIEDESGRAILSNEKFLQNNILVTGMVVGILGIEVNAGIFEILDVVYPKVSNQMPLGGSSGGKVAIVSGLNVNHGVENDLKIELLKQYLVGEIGGEEDIEYNKSIVRLIIGGNSIKPQEDVNDGELFVSMNNYGSKNISKFDNESLIKFDQFVNELVGSLPMSIMPGGSDPVEICLPQPGIHKSILHQSKPWMNGEYLQLVTNPQWFEEDGVRILGTSGQNVEDIFKYINGGENVTYSLKESVLRVLEGNIQWQHIAPTAPDTLYCYPYKESDPFLLSEMPHVYFVGNQSEYGSKLIEIEGVKVLLLAIPVFSETGEVVILNLNDLSVEIMKIEI